MFAVRNVQKVKCALKHASEVVSENEVRSSYDFCGECAQTLNLVLVLTLHHSKERIFLAQEIRTLSGCQIKVK